MHGIDSEAVGNDAEKQRKSRFLDAFYKLADTKLEYRVSGAETVIKELVKSSEESDSSDKLQYTIERLIKGLPSTRKCARVGFATTLVEVLRTFPDVTVEQVQDCIVKNLPEDAKEVNEKKFKKKVWPELQEMLSCGWEDCTPIKLYVLVQAASRFPGMVDGAFLQENWGCDSILDKANFVHIAQILQKSTIVHPNVHPVCTLILQAVITTKGFKKFWKSLMDDGLLASRRDEHVFLAVQLLGKGGILLGVLEWGMGPVDLATSGESDTENSEKLCWRCSRFHLFIQNSALSGVQRVWAAGGRGERVH
ncbi:hypothetical protein HPB50_017425 [Hyalomma asiaticum]|uniref:Uncharacterized protein n=1 Tax=Hyalomma asiaticum TaxID=266040 RepID=A0ACB7SGB3_HYAAI|nr:hypothetical protein HPB50_017425 [Hyalomma asiaticum]